MKIRTINRRMGKSESDIEIRSLSRSFSLPDDPHPWSTALMYVLVGVLVGIVMVKGQIISWLKVQEMFMLKSMQLPLTFGSAILVAFISIVIIQQRKIKTLEGKDIYFPRYKVTKGNYIGGVIAGVGWSLTGGGPAALFAMSGTGAVVMGVALLMAMVGTWMFGAVRDSLP
ncbi:MAG: YeeE/YedE thiosulfate transporter family protein [Bacteroidota bacterium]